MSTKRTTSNGDAIDCPHCGAPQRDLDDHAFKHETVEAQCGDCEKTFTLTRQVTVDYVATAEVP